MSADFVGSPGSKNRRQLPKVPSTNKPTSSLLKSSTSASSLPSNTSRTTSKLEHSISQDALTGASKKLSPMMPRVIVPPGTIPENEGEDSCVTVAVRVRPFSEREIKLGAQLAIRMYEKETAITSPEGVVRKFYYDYSFWSFDRLRGSYADQETVYSQVAAPLLDQAFEGYNTCLFAYGQTGSGKSYCIMGEADNIGIIPRFAEELFTRIDSATVEEGSSFKIEISFYEIYNEKIHDLLASTNKKNRSHLRVREHPVMGPYVEDLSTYVASSYKDIEHWITLGNKYRATAATGMNERSSRSHSVFTILFTQMSLLEGEEHSKVSRINLIDLAGSERSTLAQTSGDRLKEGASINRSLHTLGKVISLLAEKATSKRKKVFIPYRDSTLTWLLKESLGGNSKTTMIATISPTDLYHDESLSTLRYAHQARSIINVARVNEDPSAKIIRDLRAEIERLTGLLGTNSASSFAVTAVSQLLQSSSNHASDVEELQKKLKETEKLMTECTRTWEERLLESERRKQEEAEELKKAGMSFKVDNKLPNLINLNEDPQLCEILVYALKEGTTSVGRLTSASSCDIQLTGALVAPSHCEIQNDSNIVMVTPKGDAQTYINGNLIVTPTTLHHGDRLVIGGEHYFRFNHPGELADKGSSLQRSSLQNDTRRSFEFAHNEFIQAQTARIEAEVEEARLKEREILMQEIQTMKQQAQHEFEQEKQVYNEKLSLLENELEEHETKSKESAESNKEATIKIAELEEKNKRLEEETLTQRHLLQLEKLRMQKEDEEMRARKTRLITELEQEKQRLEMEVRNMQKLKETKVTTKGTSLQKGSELVQVSMLLQEANALSQALNKHVTFSRDAVYTSDGDSITRVKLTNSLTGLNTVWDLGKFESRLVQMRELMQGGQDNESVCSSVSNMSEDDPFFDPKDIWEESFSSPSRGTPSHRSSSIVSWPMSPSSRPLPDLPPSIPKHLVDALTSTRQYVEMGSPASETSSVTSDTGNYTNVFQSLLSVPSLCRDRVNNLLLALNDNHGGVAQDSVYQSILMSGWEVSNAAGDMNSFLKSPLIPPHNVPLCESSDFRQSSINLQTSLELLVNSFYHLSCTQQIPQSVDPDLSPLHYRSKLLDTIRVLTTHIAQLLECIDSEMESAIQSSVRCIRDTVESIFSLCGQLSLAECTLAHLCSKQPVQEEKTWKGQLPFKILGHFFSGQCEYTEAVLVKIASCIELKTIGQHTEGACDVVTCANQLLTAIVNLIQQVADAQDQMWPSAEEQNDLDYCSAVNPPSLHRVTEMLTLAYRVLSHVATLCNCAGMERIDCDQLTRCNTDTAGACTQLAASVLHVIRSSGCDLDIVTTNIQNLSREIMRSGKNLNHAAKRYRQHISYRVGMSMATGQVTLTNYADDGII